MDLVLVLGGEGHDAVVAVCQVRLEFEVGGLLEPQAFADVVDDLVGAVELLQSVFVGCLLRVDLFFEELDLSREPLVGLSEGLHAV